MECRLRQNYSRLPTQTTWMITLTIPRPKLGVLRPPQTTPSNILYPTSHMISDVGYSIYLMSDIVYPTSDMILDVGYSISEGVIMEQPTQNNFDSFATQYIDI